MRMSKVVLLVAAVNLAACSKYQRKYDPQRRPGPTATGESTPAPKKTPTPESDQAKTPSAPVTTPAPTAPGAEASREAAPAAHAPTVHPPEITDRKWCTLREAGFNFVVDRYVFGGGATPTTKLEQLIFAPNANPQVRSMPAPPAWTAVDSAKVGQAAIEFGVEALDTAAAQASPAFHDQAMVFNKMIDVASIEVSLDSLGDDGAVRVTRPGQPDLVLFDCQNYADDFVALDIEGEDANKPSAQASEVAPNGAVGSEEGDVGSQPLTAPTVAERGTPNAFRGALVAVNVKDVNFSGTRWCSYKNVRDDVIIGLLAFDKKKFVLNNLRASALKGPTLTKKGLRKASIGRTVRGEITTDADSKFMTSAGPSFRYVRDQRDQRALIVDNLNGAERPSSTADIFFPCEADQSPVEDQVVLKNLETAAQLGKDLR